MNKCGGSIMVTIINSTVLYTWTLLRVDLNVLCLLFFLVTKSWNGMSFPSPGDLLDPICIAGRFFTIWTTREVIYICHTHVHTHLKTSQSSTLKKINKPVSKWAVYIVELGFPGSDSCKELAASVGDVRVGVQFPGGWCSNPLQRACLENPMDGGAWRATVHRIAESDMTKVT